MLNGIINKLPRIKHITNKYSNRIKLEIVQDIVFVK